MKPILGLALAILLVFPETSFARDQIRIMGSSTVAPFATVLAEHFARDTGYEAPVTESTGTGGGIGSFCAGYDINAPDITNASRRMHSSEYAICQKNNVKEIIEIKIGSDGIVIANSLKADSYHLTPAILYLAFAKEIQQEGETIPNPYQNWSEIDPSLPDNRIDIYGPPPTSGTREAFEELVLHQGCTDLGQECDHIEIRIDGRWIDSGENDNLIISKLTKSTDHLGIFGWSYLDRNAHRVQAATINDVYPEFEAIADGSYPLTRSLYTYINKAHIGVIPGLHEFLKLIVSPEMVGEEGALTDKGLIPLPEEELAVMKDRVRNLQHMTEAPQ